MCHKFMSHPLFFISSKFFFIGFHGWIGGILAGLLTDFRGYLASGQWLAPEIFPYCFCHADFADDADFSSGILFIGFHGIYSEISCWDDYSRIFAEATCPVVADTPLRLDKEIQQRFHKKSVYICEICGTKTSHEEKSASSAKSAWQKTTGAYIGREPLASGQNSAKIRE